MSLKLHYSALSDVGQVRKDNQDSGYAGPWVLGVWDGVGGAARGDIASRTAGAAFSAIDAEPEPGEDAQKLLSDTLTSAHDAIADVVTRDPALKGTSTTATVIRFNGKSISVGHIGDSRAYLLRAGEISQLTNDHTFVQGLIDEGRITEEEARTHPHRNLILKALDGFHEADPDLFTLGVEPGDRILLCSDGVCGVLDDRRLTDILGTGTPDYAAVELVRSSLEAGSTDNVTAVVSDVLTSEDFDSDPERAELHPLPVGALAPTGFFGGRGPSKRLFSGHRSGDTGEIPVVQDEVSDDLPEGVDFAIKGDPIDPEDLRYAPRPPRRLRGLRLLLALAVVGGLVWAAIAAAYSWSQQQYYVGEGEGFVVIYRGVNADLPGVDLSEAYRISDVPVERLSDFDAQKVRAGIDVDNFEGAEEAVQNLANKMEPGDS